MTMAVNGTVSLISYGRDGKLGGSGEDADMVGTFDPRTGSWISQPLPNGN